MNPNRYDVKLRKNTYVGNIVKIAEINDFMKEDENNSTDCIRRIGTMKSNDLDISSRPKDISTGIPEIITELKENSYENLNNNEKLLADKLFEGMASVFAKDDMDLGRTNVAEHIIDTGEAQPIKQRPVAFKGEEEKEIKKMLEKDVIQESNSPWGSPIVLVKKKDGTTRFCIDYRKLNLVTKGDCYPLPRMDDCFDSLSGAKWFSTLDLASGYWQIPVHPKDREKTAFISKSGLYEFKVLPFGLSNAPSTFERCMESVLRNLQWQTCLIYLDDIIVFGKTFEEHIERLREVLCRLQQAGLKLKPSKCRLFKKSVLFLGHTISEEGLSTDPKKTEALRSWPEPTSVTEIRSFLGFCSYYRRFVRNFSHIARSLSNLTSKNVKFSWSEECQKAFDELKSKLHQSPVMAYPKKDCDFILDTDASDQGIGAVLSQKQDGQEKVIAYGSRTLNKSEQRYCVTRKELLAVVFFMNYYRHYLIGRHFLVRSDHKPLQWIFKLKDPTGQLARWLETLTSFDFTMGYRMGKAHNNADGMSRHPCPPYACTCYEFEESLDCGPCKKCEKKMTITINSVTTRSTNTTENDTDSSWIQKYSNSEIRAHQLNDPKPDQSQGQ